MLKEKKEYLPFVRYKNVQIQIAAAYDEKKSGIPFTVRGRIPRFRRKTKSANFLMSIWLLNQDVNDLSTSGWVVL